MESEKRKKTFPVELKGIAQRLLSEWTRKAKNLDQFNAYILKESVGERVFQHTQLERVANHRAYILVENSTWMNELTFLKDKIKINLNKALANQGIYIEEISFKIGKIQKSSESSADVPPLGK
jgi:hypothetical protein